MPLELVIHQKLLGWPTECWATWSRIISRLTGAIRAEPTVVTAETEFEMATIGGALAPGLDHLIGSIEAGKPRRFHRRPHGRPALGADVHSPWPTSSYASTEPTSTVVVAGRTLMESRVLATIDGERVRAEARAAVEALYERSGVSRPTVWPVS